MMPRVGVVGIAGPVLDNAVQVSANLRHWGKSDGYLIQEMFNLDSFLFINDFTAAGYGVTRLEEKDATPLTGTEHVTL